MQCLRCQAENAEGARFREDCGARLDLACPSCGQPATGGNMRSGLAQADAGT